MWRPEGATRGFMAPWVDWAMCSCCWAWYGSLPDVCQLAVCIGPPRSATFRCSGDYDTNIPQQRLHNTLHNKACATKYCTTSIAQQSSHNRLHNEAGTTSIAPQQILHHNSSLHEGAPCPAIKWLPAILSLFWLWGRGVAYMRQCSFL